MNNYIVIAEHPPCYLPAAAEGEDHSAGGVL